MSRPEYKGPLNSRKKFKAWLDLESFPVFDEISQNNFQRYLDRAIPVLYLFVNASQKAETSMAKAAVLPVAVQYREHVSFVYVDASPQPDTMQKYGLSGDQLPAIAIDQNSEKAVNYAPFPEGASFDGLGKFVGSYLDGTLVRSAAVPSQPVDDGITTVVGSTFHQLVLNNDKDVLIELFSPWCKRSRDLGPLYNKFAKALENVPTLMVARMDCTVNGVPKDLWDRVEGYPTVFFIPAGTKASPIMFEGERTTLNLLKFVQKYATHPLNVDESTLA
jgi:protein disulfide-isomerase A1